MRDVRVLVGDDAGRSRVDLNGGHRLYAVLRERARESPDPIKQGNCDKSGVHDAVPVVALRLFLISR